MRRKRVSKRRWIARFRIGKLIPYMVLMEMPELKKRLVPFEYAAANIDAIRRAA